MYKVSKDTAWLQILWRICIGVGLKFMLGSDDIVWLAPFMARARTVQHKMDIGIKYVISVLFLTLVACALAVLIHTAAHSGKGDEIVDECIATVAAFLLFAYAIHMAYVDQYFSSCIGKAEVAPDEEEDNKRDGYGAIVDEDDEEKNLGPFKSTIKRSLTQMSETCDMYCSCVDADTRELSKDLDDENDNVVIVAFLGSMDDFMVYFTLALSHQLTWFELSLGVTIGGILIALIVGVLLQASTTLANAVESIPVPLVLAGLSVFILVSAWTSFDGF